MPRFVNVHGRFIPHGAAQVKVLNVNFKKKQDTKISVQKLFKKDNPTVMVHRRIGGIGDILNSTPLCAEIKRLIPHCTLYYATDLEYLNGTLKSLLEHCPAIDVICSSRETRKDQCDYFVDITTTGLDRERKGNLPPSRIDMFAEEAGLTVDHNPVPIYVIKDRERDKLQNELKRHEEKTVIGIQVRANDARRTWPIKYTEQLIELLSSDPNVHILIFDWGTDLQRWTKYHNHNNVFPILDRNIEDTAVLLERTDLVICPGSGLLHLAAALGKKILSIFGPIPAENRIKHYVNASAIQLDLPCSGCCYTPTCMRRGETTLEKMACLTGITPNMVYQKALEKLTEETRPMQLQYGQSWSADKDRAILIKLFSEDPEDVFLSIRAIEALKVKHPYSQIHFQTNKEHKELLENFYYYIDEIIEEDKEVKTSDYLLIADLSKAYDLYRSKREDFRKQVQKNKTEVFAEILNVQDIISSNLPIFFLEKKDITHIKRRLKGKENKSLLILGVNELQDTYLYKNLDKLIRQLKDEYYILSLFPIENSSIKDISSWSFKEKTAAICCSNICLFTDNIYVYLSNIFNVPSIVFSGPLRSNILYKGQKYTSIITSNRPCSPCWKKYINKACSNNNKECLHDFSLKQLRQIIDTKAALRKEIYYPEYKPRSISIPFHYQHQYGFGDILIDWFNKDAWPKILYSLSKRNKVNLLVCCHNENAKDFFKNIDFIDTHIIPWKGQTPNYQKIANSLNSDLLSERYRNHLSMYKSEDFKRVWLSKEDQKTFDKISAEPYICIHPFAGEKNRKAITESDLISLIDRFIEEEKQKVVIIGGSYIRNRRLRNIPEQKITEELNYERDGLINLVNKCSITLSTALAVNSEYMIGNWSAFTCAGIAKKIPTIVITEKKWTYFLRDQNLKDQTGNKFKIENNCIIIPANEVSKEKLKEEIINSYCYLKAQTNKEIYKNIFIWCYGGYGDCLCAYLGLHNRRGTHAFSKIQGLKEKYPDINITAVVMSGNKESVRLTERNPYIDKTIWAPTPEINNIDDSLIQYIHSFAPGTKDLDLIEEIKTIPTRQNKIYLTPKENDILTKVLKNKIIVFHPFASLPARRNLTEKHIKSIIKIIEKTEYKLIVVGKSYSQHLTTKNNSITESFDSNSSSIINLVNKENVSLPLISSIIIKSNGVIGNWSCHTTLGIYYKKPTLTFVNDRGLRYFSAIHPHQNFSKIINQQINLEDIELFISRL